MHKSPVGGIFCELLILKFFKEGIYEFRGDGKWNDEFNGFVDTHLKAQI